MPKTEFQPPEISHLWSSYIQITRRLLCLPRDSGSWVRISTANLCFSPKLLVPFHQIVHFQPTTFHPYHSLSSSGSGLYERSYILFWQYYCMFASDRSNGIIVFQQIHQWGLHAVIWIWSIKNYELWITLFAYMFKIFTLTVNQYIEDLQLH